MTPLGLALLVLCGFAAFSFGAVHGWAGALVEIGVWSLAAGILVRRKKLLERDPRAAKVVAAGAALLAWLTFHLVPLPDAVVAVVSPAAREIHRTADAVLEEAAPPAVAAERGFAAVEPPAWRPLALHPFAAWTRLRGLAACGALLLLAAAVARPARLLLGIALLTGALSLFALIQFATWNGYLYWFFAPYEAGARPALPRVTGPFVNPDHLATYLAMASPVSAGLLLWSLVGRRKSVAASVPAAAVGLLAVATALTAAALLGTGSRAGITSAAVGLVCFSAGAALAARRVSRGSSGPERWRNRMQRLVPQLAPAAVAALVVAGGLLYAGPEVRGAAGNRFLEAIRDADLGFRSLMWQQSLPLLREYAVTGTGLDGWQEVFRQQQRYPVVGFRPNHLHGDYLEWSIEVGGLGLVLTVILVWRYLGWARSNSSVPSEIRSGMLGALAAVASHEAFDFGLRVPANALMLAIMAGLLCNRSWGRECATPSADDDGEPRRSRGGRRMRPAAFAILAVLLFGSGRAFAEFLEWSRARGGATQLRFEPRCADTWYELGRNLARNGEGTAARGALLRAVSLRPAFAEAYRRLATLEPATETKLRIMNAAIDLHPTRAGWRAYRAYLLERRGRGEEALTEIETAAFLDPRLSAHRYLEHGPSRALLEAAEKGFRGALERHPEHSELLHELARFYLALGRWSDAGELWTQIAEGSGDWATYGLRAGEAYARAEEWARAERAVRRSIRDAPSRTEGYRTLVLRVLGPQGMAAEAAAVVEEGARRVENPSALYLALHELFRSRAESGPALEALERAASLRRQDAALQASLGRAYLDAGAYHRARAAFTRAIDLAAHHPSWHYARGLAAERLYDFDAARKAYARAAELEASNATYAAALDRMNRAFRDTINRRGS